MKKEIKLYICLVVIVSVMCFPYLTMHYSTDSYAMIGNGYYKYGIENFLNEGRLFSSGITVFAGYINLPINIFVQILFYLGILISCLCVMEIRRCIIKIKPEKNWKEKVLVIGIAFCIIFNFMYLENMYFAEIPVMALGILLFIKASEKLVDEKYIISLIYLLIGELCYQGTINFFITFTFLLLLIKNNKINKDLIIKMLIAVLFCVIVLFINIVQIKICGKIFNLEQTRLGNIKSIPNNIIYILNNMDKILIKTSDLFPKYFFMIFIITIYISIVVYDLKNIKRYSNSFNVLFLIIMAIASSVAINVISLSSFGLGRMVFSVGTLIGLIFMYLYCATDIFSKKSFWEEFLKFYLIMYIILNFINYTNIMFSGKIANKLDKEEALQANKFIDEYENESGIKVKHIAVAYDNDITWNYKEIKHKSLYTHRALMIWWCNVQTINYYGNRNLEKVPMDSEIYNENFYGKNWDSLNKEQFVFKGDTLYYCVY